MEGQGPTGFAFGDGSIATGGTGPILRFLVTGFDTVEPNTDEHWVIGEALDPVSGTVGIRHTYAGPGPFLAHTAVAGGTSVSCCRIGQFGLVSLNNRSGLRYPIQTDVLPFSGNSSPVSGQLPIVVVPHSASVSFLVPAADADGDQIQWRMSTDAEAGGPSHPPNISVNPSTGVVTWNNLGLSTTGSWTTQVVVEDLDASGAVKTKTPVDFLLKIRPQVGSLPACQISPSGPLTGIVDRPFSFVVTGTDADPGATVTLTLNIGGLPPGASMTPSLPVTGSSTVSSTFNWTPTAAQEGAHVVVFSATDNDFQQGLCSTTIDVIRVIPVDIDIKPDSDPNSINVGNKGRIPVAILTTDDFDAADVDPASVTLGDDDGNDTGVAARKNGTLFASLEDVDNDGDLDLILHFDTQALVGNGDLDAGTTELILNGDTTGGQPIQGSDSVNIVPL